MKVNLIVGFPSRMAMSAPFDEAGNEEDPCARGRPRSPPSGRTRSSGGALPPRSVRRATPWPADLEGDDRINDWIRDQHADRSPEQLVADYDASYDRLAEILESLPEEKLSVELPWIGEPLVEEDFTSHLHDEHVSAVRAWLDGTGS